MARGINIEFVSDVRRFLSGTKDVEKALDNVSESLDDVARDAQRAGDKVGQSLESAGDEAKDAGKKIGSEIEDGTDKAEDAAKKLEQKFRDIFKDVKGDARKAGDSIGDDIKRGTREAGEGVDNFKEESRDTAREVAASFDGSAESIAGGFQEVLANAFLGFGPAGAAAGIAAAAGAGLFYAMWQENAEKTEARIASMYEDMLESGQRFLSGQFINENITGILHSAEDAVIDYAQAQEIAARTGLDLQTVVRAYAGDAEAAASVSDGLARAQAEIGDASSSTNFVLNSARDALDSVTESTATAAEKADIYAGAMVVTEEAAREFAIAQAGVDASLVAAQDAIKANTEAYGSNETQLREKNLGTLAAFAGELAGVNEAAVAAGQTGDALTRSQERQYGAFMAAARAAGLAEDEARELARQFGLVPGNVTTTVSTPGLEDAIRKAQSLADIMRLTPDYKNIAFTSSVKGATPVARASGGYVHGPGGTLDDGIAARLSRGEYVLDAATVQRVGVGRLDQLNNGQPQTRGRGGGSGTTLNVSIGELHAEDPRHAAKLVERRLRDAIAVHLGGVA